MIMLFVFVLKYSSVHKYPLVYLLVLVHSLIRAEVPEAHSDDPTAVIADGTVKGRTQFLETLFRHVDVYRGIPFAKPPLGELRFQYPQPPDKWEGIFEATRIAPPCWQISDMTYGSEFRGSNMWNSAIEPSEDCLYLNVYVPNEPKTGANVTKYAVMVWIYGGGFYSGSSNLDVYDGRYLSALSSTIVVSMNYRVGALGFLTFNDSSAPPNIGLYDQLMALQWVQDNIAAFGGDPDNVTIFGESAGAASVSLHLLSPLSRTKFHRAILQSGSSNAPWGAISIEEAIARATALAKKLNCLDKNNNETYNIDEVTNCLKEKTAALITQEQKLFDGIVSVSFSPTVDGGFLPNRPKVLLERHEFKECPIIIGSNSNEGSYFLPYSFPDNLNLDSARMSREEYEVGFKQIFTYFPHYPIEMSEEHLAGATALYDPHKLNQTSDMDLIHALDMAVGDSHFVCPLHFFARAYASADQTVYAYYFTHRIVHHEWPDWMGVLHGDEILFMFSDVAKYIHNYTSEEKRLSKMMISYWSNFAKTANPNGLVQNPTMPVWPVFMVNHEQFLVLDTENLDSLNSTTVGELRNAECAFWNNL